MRGDQYKELLLNSDENLNDMEYISNIEDIPDSKIQQLTVDKNILYDRLKEKYDIEFANFITNQLKCRNKVHLNDLLAVIK